METAVRVVTASQVRGIIGYENRLQWRSGRWLLTAFGSVVLILFILGMFGSIPPGTQFAGLMDRYINTVEWNTETQQFDIVTLGVVRVADFLPGVILTDADIARIQHTIIAVQALWIGQLFLLVALALMMSDVLVVDRTLNVQPLLDSTPLTVRTYLTGKVLSVWRNALLINLAIVILLLVLLRVRYGNYDLHVLLLEWLLGVVPFTLFVGGLAIMIPSLMGTRRQALMLGVVCVPFYLIAYAQVMIAMYSITGVIEPVYRFSNLLIDGYLPNHVFINNVVQLYLLGLLCFTAITLTVWWMQRRRRV